MVESKPQSGNATDDDTPDVAGMVDLEPPAGTGPATSATPPVLGHQSVTWERAARQGHSGQDPCARQGYVRTQQRGSGVSEDGSLRQWKDASASREHVAGLLLKLLARLKDAAPQPLMQTRGPPGEEMPRVWREHHKGDFAHAADLEMGRHLDAAVRKGDCQTIIPLGHDSAVRSLPTTLMVLSVPTACTREDLASEWGMDGSWDFLYLPMYSGGKRALGYAFINFVSETASADFFSRWQGRHLANFQRGRPLNIVVAELQGFEANLCHVRQKSAGRLRSRQCRPIVVRDGQRVDMDDV